MSNANFRFSDQICCRYLSSIKCSLIINVYVSQTEKIFLHNIHRCNLKREGDVNYVIAMTLLGWGYMIITQPSCIGLCLDPESRI